MPKFSVIIPVYNVERFIHRCVDSILAQSFTDFELLLIDDGSTDRSGKICDEYARQDERIRVIHKENGGLSSARNAGLDRAIGEYICFVDSDDYIRSDMLETISAYLNGDKRSVSFGFSIQTPSGNIRNEYLGNMTKKSIVNDKDRLRFFCNELTDYRVSWTAWSKVFSRAVIEREHLRFADNAGIYAEDLFFSLCYMAFADEIVNVQKPLYVYCERDDSIMGTDAKKNNVRRFVNLANAVERFYQHHNSCDYLCRHFSLIYFKIMYIAYTRLTAAFPDRELSAYRRLFMDEVPEKETDRFNKHIKEAYRQRDDLFNEYSSHEDRLYYLLMFRYFIDGNYFALRVRFKIARLLLKG